MKSPFIYGRGEYKQPQETLDNQPSSFGNDFLQKAYAGQHNYTNVRAQAPAGKFPSRPRPQELMIHKDNRERRPFSGYVMALKGRGISELEDPL